MDEHEQKRGVYTQAKMHIGNIMESCFIKVG